jgi:hypothetical protein
MGIVALAPAALAQEQPRVQVAPQAPATAPAAAMAEAATPADPTTPKGTLTLLTRARMTGQTGDARKLFHATNPRESKFADVLLELTSVEGKFRDAAIKQFGADAIGGDLNADTAAAERMIQDAPVEVDNDNATVQLGGEAMKLVKVDGAWKLSVSALTGEMPAAQMDKATEMIQMRSTVMSQTTNEVTEGKYKSPDEVIDAVRGRLAAATLAAAAAEAAEAAPATQPATLPASGQ